MRPTQRSRRDTSAGGESDREGAHAVWVSAVPTVGVIGGISVGTAAFRGKGSCNFYRLFDNSRYCPKGQYCAASIPPPRPNMESNQVSTGAAVTLPNKVDREVTSLRTRQHHQPCLDLDSLS
jgi:hypothetical protein